MKTGLIALGAALSVLALARPALGDTTLVVDKDRAQCPDADFQSIQSAVTAAVPGTTINEKYVPDQSPFFGRLNPSPLPPVGGPDVFGSLRL